MQFLELQNQEFFLEMNAGRPIKKEYKERLLTNIKRMDATSPFIKLRVDAVIEKINKLKTID